MTQVAPQFFPVTRAQLAGLPQFPAPSALSLPRSPVLNPNPHGTFSWPTSKSPLTLFLPAVSLLHSSELLSAYLLHLAFQLPKLCGKGSPKATWSRPNFLAKSWVVPTNYKLSHRCYNQGELLPSYILGGSHSHLPGSKHGHSYLTHPWNWLKVIDMLNDHARGVTMLNDSSQWPCSVCPIPQLRLVGERTSYMYFF